MLTLTEAMNRLAGTTGLMDTGAANQILGRTAGLWTPDQYGLLTWTCDPFLATGTTNPGPAGTIFPCRLYTYVPIRVTNLHIAITTAGATLTAGQNKAAIFDAAGNLLGTTVDQATAWQSTGFKTMALTAPVDVPAGFFDVGHWYNGTTAPTLMRGNASVFANLGLVGASLRFASANTGLTTTAPATLGAKSSTGTSLWWAVS